MTEPSKMVSRRVAIAFAVLCIATLVGLNISIIVYFSEATNKNNQIQTLNDQIVTLQTQVANLTQTSPKLVSIGMQYYDNRTNQNALFLRVTGYVCNVGTGKANNCVLHVNAIQSGNDTAIDTSANINPLNSGEFRLIDLQFAYTGQPIVAYSTSLDWTT